MDPDATVARWRSSSTLRPLPELSSEQWARVKEVFHAAVERPRAERGAFVHDTCGDTAVASAVEWLLTGDDAAESFMETPAAALVGPPAPEGSALSVGQQLGPYTIVARIGAGGMGEVYRAHDTKLGRDVAVKVLPASLASHPDRLARFDREARLLATLNHPNIATIHGIEDAPDKTGRDIRAIVMELIDGETVAQRLQRGPIPPADALAIARQIADALEAAHEKGIIHRDLKPANVKVMPNGTVKVLDFGLAKAMGLEIAGVDLSHLPTVTASGTHQGVILGTAGYMSPEQARGQAVDKRTDIWAFGCILYEMLTGRRAFSGDTTADTVAALLEREPDWQVLPSSISAPLRELLHRCLHKDASRRLRAIGDVRLELDEALAALKDAKRPSRVRTKSPSRVGTLSQLAAPGGPARKYTVVAAAAVVLLLATVLLWSGTNLRETLGFGEAPVRILAVLPLKPLEQSLGDAHVGLGLADMMIMRIGLIEGIIVRPTSAVRKYGSVDSDALKAARELQVDAVLDGTIQRSGEQLRVNLTLLKASNGSSLWSETFTKNFRDIFALEDEIAGKVVSQLRLRLSAAERLRLTKHYTSSPKAYEYYWKGVATFSTVGSASPTNVGDLEPGVKMLEEAVKLDPKFALAHSRLAWGYTWLGVNNGNRTMIDRGRKALAVADALDRDLAESYLVRHLLLWSAFENYQIIPAFEAARKAQQLNENVGHYELGQFYAHLGMVEPALHELRRALEIDPTNDAVRAEIPQVYWYSARYEEAIAEYQRLGANVPWVYFYYLGAGRLKEGRRLIDVAVDRDPRDPVVPGARALLLALEGKHAAAQARALRPPLSDLAQLQRNIHHGTYLQACVFALGGNADIAVQWLDETVKTGMPIYPAFERDRCFDQIRRDQRFVQFMASLKPTWDAYVRQMH